MSIKGDIAIPFAHPVYVRGVLDCLNSRGVRPSEVLANAGLSWQALSDGQRMVDFSVFRRFVAQAIQSSGEPALGLMAGSMLQPYHSPVGIATVSSDNLGQALRVLSRHARLIFRGLEFEVDDGARWSVLKVKPVRPLVETHVFVMQSILGAYCRLLEAILGRPADELVVGLPYARPADNDVPCLRYVRKVEFGQECLSFQLPVELLRTPSIAADPRAFSEAAQACRKMESEIGSGDFVQQVRHALLERLTRNPDVGELAVDLGISARTLVRRLAEVGATYSDIKDQLRKAHAAWYLKHTELSMEAIASQLGYNDPTNFSRKFKNWYRVPPSKMRQTLRSGLH
ncbi:AraC family transcriptional regulator [Variovorax saccharolyticus]|uniref:AraC family transcriptional regulator n=1 Tax=Variovorax saccharolyticus TaxID=3053516 RepID=UPI002577BF26|nr:MULTISPECIES: AraC family transcriptional regulator [unclassified Variovorax]MDM0020707.1 AraC family transcriptional regulator ligand-binding domain-containing protein [Variovorax sp. J22R187]MDM0025706.1 AraC family transcriptional regulator ligand-binding domain-containing protein [Variovorax sp. J31P216]